MEAAQLAAELDSLNQTRRDIEQAWWQTPKWFSSNHARSEPDGHFVYHESFHQESLASWRDSFAKDFIALRLFSLMHLRARRTKGPARY